MLFTTRSGKTLEEPSIPLVPTPDVSKPQKEPEQNPETSTEKVQNPNLENTAHVPSPGEEDSIFMELPKPKAKKTVNLDPNPNSYPSKLPYPERMKVREHDKPSAQYSRFLKMFKQLRLEIGLKDALVENARVQTVFPRTRKDPGKFLIPCALQELDRTSALADSGASINLLPHSIYKKLGLEALTPTRMTLELANRSISHPMGIAEDVVVRVDGFTFLADFVVVNFEPDPRVPIILGRPFLRTAKALIDLYEEKLTLREKDVKIKSSTSSTLTSPEASELEDYLEKDSIPPGIDLALPTTLEVLSSNPTSPTLTDESIILNSLGNEDKVFKPGILVYHAIHDKNLETLEENSKENISSGTLLVFKEPSIFLPPLEPPDECLKNVVLNFYQSKKTFPLNVEDVNSFAFIIWTFLPFFTYTKASPVIFSFQSENFVFDPGIITFHNPVAVSMKVSICSP
ncbi:reverse transcriptase domain-containing protein [Tanacetum coccineum]|uniref:Reverse transcriptase domain-containing protein n=1 Tax=Tanacetum coccineum TaxID=301880 RepID=A0ABQ5EB25_9ASTR